MQTYTFQKAVPVWEVGKDKELNYHLVFRTMVKKSGNTKICLSASNMYQMFIGGNLIAEGPARAGHNYYRVDEIDISKYLTEDTNIVTIYVASYYVKNFYLPRHPGFFCAEVIENGEVIAATGDCGFVAMHHDARIQKIDRYSFQRTFSEAYHLDADFRAFEKDVDYAFTPVTLVPTEEKKFITRHVPYACYDEFNAKTIVGKGSFTYRPTLASPRMDRWIFLDGVIKDEGFSREAAEVFVIDEMDKCEYSLTSEASTPFENAEIKGGEFSIFDYGAEKTGFIELDFTCEEETQIIISFDEILINGDVIVRRFDATNGILLYAKPGSYRFIANEPSSMRYIKIANKSEGLLKLQRVGFKEFAFDYHDEGLKSSNEALNRIYKAAIETFRQNTLDIYMDCPSRERAGWLCDSFFTSKVEYALTGKSLVERNFLENFIMAEGFTDIPEDMIAMCYPSDFPVLEFIPNWAMFYVIELGEYFDRTNDREMVDYAKDKVTALYNYFCRLKNADGLLENLENWVFVEWSKANDFIQNVNYPSNMLYTLALRTMGRLYDEKYTKEAEAMMETIRKQSYFNGFFHDHAVRQEDGTLIVPEADVTETCQYYAFFTETATPETYPELWNTLLTEFGPDRQEKGLWKEIYPSNAFIGNYLRLYLLDRHGKKEALLANIEGYFDYMAKTTGTLWELTAPQASCNHGFASLVAVWLRKWAK